MAELRETAGDRPDLLAETAGPALGTAEGQGPAYQAQAQAVAELCREADANEDLIRDGSRRVGVAPRLRDGRHFKVVCTR